MNALSNVTSQNISSYAPPSANSTQPVRSRDADGDDDDGNKKTGRAERSNFLAAIEQALIQTLTNQASTSSTSTTSTSSSTSTASTTATPTTNPSTTTTPASTSTTSPTQSPQEALKTFIHSLFSVLHTATNSNSTINSTSAAGGAVIANSTPTTGNVSVSSSGDSDEDGDSDGSAATSEVRHHEHDHGSLANKIQSLIQQLSTSTSGTPATGNPNAPASTSQPPATTTTPITTSTPNTTDPLSDLKTSFQNLINAVTASQTQASANNTSASLQTFLQNLLQDLNGGSSSTGTLINTQA